MYICIWHGIDDTGIQDILYTYMNTWYIYIYILCYIYGLRKSNNYSLKSAQYNSVIILWKEDDAK